MGDLRSTRREHASSELARRALPLVLSCVAVVVLVLLLYYLVDVFLLAFAGALLAIVVRAPAEWLAARTRLSPTWALVLVLVGLAGLIGGLGWFFGQGIADQLGMLSRRLPELIAELRGKLADFEWLFGQFDPREWLAATGGAVGRGLGAVVATFGVAANLVIVFFVALFFALQPRLYVDGVLRLVPPTRRDRARQVLSANGDILRSWLLGQLFLMSTIAVVTGIALLALGVPLALALALIAGLLEFIPYVGPILAAVPAVLVALAESPQLAGYVLLLYLGIQLIEGNILQPLVQHRTAYLPPALVLLSQLVLGVLVGALGVMLATPLAASALLSVKMLYLQDTLGEPREPVS